MHQSTATTYTQESGISGSIDLLFSRALHCADAGIAAGPKDHTAKNKLYPLTTEKQQQNFCLPIFKKKLSPSCTILRIQRLEGKQCRS